MNLVAYLYIFRLYDSNELICELNPETPKYAHKDRTDLIKIELTCLPFVVGLLVNFHS